MVRCILPLSFKLLLLCEEEADNRNIDKLSQGLREAGKKVDTHESGKNIEGRSHV